ncbi:uncharacterized protein LOC143244486 isoform X3 [Tachypleus tridentatus]|uniref:uncharacterized protein LOC143244486 isoform X3 n=1 Tax=Tachypleus tridentatus TaxID=6853 RepID=UPI003FD3CC74
MPLQVLRLQEVSVFIFCHMLTINIKNILFHVNSNSHTNVCRQGNSTCNKSVVVLLNVIEALNTHSRCNHERQRHRLADFSSLKRVREKKQRSKTLADTFGTFQDTITSEKLVCSAPTGREDTHPVST